MHVDKRIVIYYSHKSEGEKLFESLASDHYAEPDQESILFKILPIGFTGRHRSKRGKAGSE